MELLHLKAAVTMGSLPFPGRSGVPSAPPYYALGDHWHRGLPDTVVRGLRGECAQGRYPGRIWVQPPAPAVSADLRLDTRAATGRGDCCGASSRWLAGEISQPSTPVLLALALHHGRSLPHGRLLSGRPTIHTRCFLGRCRESVRFWKKSPKGQPQEGGSSPSGDGRVCPIHRMQLCGPPRGALGSNRTRT